MPYGKAVLEAISSLTPVSYELVDMKCGFETYQQTGSALPEETVNEIKKCKASLFGAAATPSPPPFGYLPPVVEFRNKLDLWANLRPMRSVPLDVVGGRNNVDMIVVRENTECLYAGKERYTQSSTSGKMAVAERVVSEKASKRIARLAFEIAIARSKKRGRPGHVTIVHKANVLRLSEGLFLDCCLDVAKEFPDIYTDHTLLDSFMYKAMAHPVDYDVVVTTNTWGNIISNGMSPMVGGLGMVYGINYGANHIMAEPIHGTPAHLEGKGICNPLAMMRAAAGLADRVSPGLNLLGLFYKAVSEVVQNDKKYLTRDIGGTATTEECAAEVMRHFRAILSQK
uniref:Isopropylmalate dehydrogenase-like domain-containing protein n=1 Tax=Eutreptiella gymnastica TaxID=73025 RepID=A0A6U7TS17_9EUGL